MPSGDLAYVIYLAVFAVAAAGCLAGAWRARRQVSLAGVRLGLTSLLLASGLWALCHVGVLLSPGLGLKVAFYEAGLTVGFGTVFAWLWLCSAYSGRALHRRPSVRWAALAVFAAVTLTKLTNRWHGLYFGAEISTGPFPHLAVDHHVIYWLTAGLSYALAAVGFFMLAEPLRRAQVGGKRLAGLFALTALPLGANAIGYATPYLLDLSHEPVGVAAFALGALALKGSPSSGSRKESCLEEASRAGREKRPSLVLSADGRIRNYNRAAAELIPALRKGTPEEGTPQEEEIAGRHLEEALPRLGRALNGESPGAEPSGTEPSGAEPSGAELSGKNPSGKELEGKKGPRDNKGPEENEELRENGRRSEEKFSAEKPSAEEKLLEVPAGGGEARYYRPVESKAGPGAGRLVVLQDVTEQVLRRRERASRLEAISDSMPGLAFEFRAGPGGERSVEFIGEEAESFLGLSLGLEDSHRRSSRRRSSQKEFSQEQFSYRQFTERVPEGHREAFLQSVEEAVEGRSAWRHEFPFERPDGERIWLLGSAEPSAESGPGEEEVVFRGTLADITGRKRREQELRESRRELRREKRRAESITENVSEGIYRSTEEGIVYANSAFIEMFGYRDLEELREAGPEALYVDPSRREELIEKEHRHGRLCQEEVRYRRKDGTVFVALLSSQQVEGEEEGKTYFDGAITDITERRRRKEELKRKKEELERKNDLFERAQEIASVGAWEHDLQAGENRWTSEVYRIYGYEDASGPVPPVENGVEFYHPEDRPAVRSAFEKAVEEGRSFDIEARLITEDGEEKWVRARGEPQREDGSSEGEVARVRGTLQDITDRKEREEALRAAKEETERSRKEAEEARQEAEEARQEAEEARQEAETSRREAEEAKEEAQEASRLKSALLANMSHEIRTPLTSIIGFAEMLGREASGLELPEESPLPGYASTIEQGGKRLLETLNGVLNLSKLQAGQMEMEAGPVDLSEQARLAAEELRPEAEEKGIGLELETGGGPTDGKANPAAVEGRPALAEADIFAEADEGGVQIVLRNLLSNAIKYTEEGGVTVRTYREDGDHKDGDQEDGNQEDGNQEDGNQEDGDQEDGHPQEDSWAVLEVEDTGIGMDPEVAEGLFEPFRQASEGMSREYEGTGIGLAVTREAVAQMGGSIEVETQKGAGTCMTVRLPLAREAGAA
ncbi:PAS domain-containing protein [Salinibacter ruber]|uniref:PAS domain-containing protein n=1 Tax=Salinibacter ruber TaxID=146919 RepID=UPI002073F08E|nr:PAS domain-containing protein [Salinibacter ruber]